MDNRSIGVFDSGIGGLTVVKELTKILPNEKIVYFGDTARVPYGTRSEETIKRFSKECIEFLNQKDIKALIIACNTVSAVALEMLKELFDMYILGVIIPGSKMASYVTKNKKIGVIGTNATVLSGAYEKCIKSENSENIVYSKACPLFVPAVEEGILEGKLMNQIVKTYLDEFDGKIDSLILGCTHYPLLKDVISKIYPEINIVDPAKETALDLEKILEENNLLENDAEKGNEVEYYVTDGEDKFKEVGTMFLGKNIKKVNLIKL